MGELGSGLANRELDEFHVEIRITCCDAKCVENGKTGSNNTPLHFDHLFIIRVLLLEELGVSNGFLHGI
jgi:hypothetical protein